MGFSEELKVRIRKKAHHTCCLCKSLGIEIHHIVSEKDGGPDTEDNAAPLCPSCHEIYGGNPDKRKFLREVRDFWYDICKRGIGDGSCILDILRFTQAASSVPGDKYTPDYSVPGPQRDPILLFPYKSFPPDL